MQNKLTQVNDTKVKIEVTADADTLALTLQQTLKDFQKSMKLPGFREGKAPLNIVEKNADQSRLQASFIDSAINDLYSKAVIENDLKPVSQPSVSIKKFVPFSLLEVEFEVEVIGKLEITDYKKIRVARKPVTVTAKDIADTMESLQDRFAEGKEVKRAAKDGDQVVINFHGFDSKTKEPISGADGKAYPLVIGSNAFIPGFEPELIGLKPDEEKTFEITFPKDYNVSFLQSKKVTFDIKINQINELKKSPLDDAFAAKVGPFKDLAELKADIKKQLKDEKEQRELQLYQSEVITELTNKSKVTIPDALIDEQVERSEEEEKQNLIRQGQTWKEHLEIEGITEAEHRKRNRPTAENIVKSSLILSQIAQDEKITVTPEEIDLRVQLLKGQYQDPQMHAELSKPENLNGIRNQLLTEKTFEYLSKLASK